MDIEFYRLKYYSVQNLHLLVDNYLEIESDNSLEANRLLRYIFSSIANVGLNFDKLDSRVLQDKLLKFIIDKELDRGVYAFKRVHYSIDDYNPNPKEPDVVTTTIYKDNFSETYVQVKRQILIGSETVSEVKFNLVEPKMETVVKYRLLDEEGN